MKKLLTVFLFVLSFPSLSQTLFPEKCIGTWQGMMHIYSQGILRDSVDVKFTVAKTAEPTAWVWRTEYRSQKQPMVKDYVLKLKDQDKGIFLTDEGGGVELLDYQIGNKLYSAFEIPGALLTASYELLNPTTLIFEVTSGKKGDVTGQGIYNYSVSTVQRVVLKK